MTLLLLYINIYTFNLVLVLHYYWFNSFIVCFCIKLIYNYYHYYSVGNTRREKKRNNKQALYSKLNFVLLTMLLCLFSCYTFLNEFIILVN